MIFPEKSTAGDLEMNDSNRVFVAGGAGTVGRASG
jgi:hypothetical protein